MRIHRLVYLPVFDNLSYYSLLVGSPMSLHTLSCARGNLQTRMGGAQVNCESPVRDNSKRVNFRDQRLVSQVHGASASGFGSLGSSTLSDAETDRSATPDRFLNTRASDRMQCPSSGPDSASSNGGQPRPFRPHWEAWLETRASGTVVSARGRHGALQTKGEESMTEQRRPTSSLQQESESISRHSSKTLTSCVRHLDDLEQTQRPETLCLSTAQTSGDYASARFGMTHGKAVARSSPSSLHAATEQDTRKLAAALRLVQHAGRSELLRTLKYSSKSELIGTQTAPASTTAHRREGQTVVRVAPLDHSTKGVSTQSLSRRPSQASGRSSALGASSVDNVSEAEAARRSARDWWMQAVSREKYARAAMLASCDS